jgi:RHS repeat-associated protein
MQDESFSSSDNTNFLFNSKELQTFADLNFYDYHARQYDPQLGRWHSPDPADQFFGISGYAYCANNPVMYVDPDGREITTAFVIAALWTGFKIGAVTTAITYTATHLNNFNVQHFLEATITGGLVSAATAGLDLGSSYLGLALLGKTTGLTRGLLGLG